MESAGSVHVPAHKHSIPRKHCSLLAPHDSPRRLYTVFGNAVVASAVVPEFAVVPADVVASAVVVAAEVVSEFAVVTTADVTGAAVVVASAVVVVTAVITAAVVLPTETPSREVSLDTAAFRSELKLSAPMVAE